MSPLAVKCIRLVALATVVLVLAGCLSIRLGTGGGTSARSHAAPAASEDFVLTLGGPEGMKFKGTVTADGVAQEVGGTVPYELRIKARALVCEFKKDAGEGVLELTVVRGDQKGGSISSTGGPHGVRAELGGGNTIITGF